VPYGVLGALFLCDSALLLIRRGRVRDAGLLLVATVDVALAACLFSGSLALRLGALFDLSALAVLVALCLLPALVMLLVALANAVLFAVALVVLTHGHFLARPGTLALLLSAAALQLLLGVVLALHAQSHAEERERIGNNARAHEAEWRYAAERALALEEDIRRLSEALEGMDSDGRIASGVSVRVPFLRDVQLTEVARRVNRLLGSLERTGRDGERLVTIQRDAQQVVAALDTLRAGNDPTWPEPHGTPMDFVVDALQGVTNWSDEPLPMPAPITPQLLTGLEVEDGDAPAGEDAHATWAERLEAALAGGRRDFRQLRLVGMDLSDVDLPGVDLRSSNFTGAGLTDADLTGADLRDATLIRADLSGAHLSGARLSGANLTGTLLMTADLTHVDCTEATLCDANLSGADLHYANLVGADLAGADLSKADLYGAELRHAALRRARLAGATLIAAQMQNASLEGAKLTGARLSLADMQGAILTDADLHDADLADADLSGANLAGADLSGANLSGADLRRTDLSGADLRGADLSGADLTGARLDDAALDDSQRGSALSHSVK
jgi:uncharacterized protein YjbI with pentapeptide repeats